MPETIQSLPTFEDLYRSARAVINPRKLSECAEAGEVGAALLSESGIIYTGVCLDVACGIGFCAEHSAGAAMVTAGESRVLKMIAVGFDGKILPPCGRCREFIGSLHSQNLDTQVMISETVTLSLRELLPYDWRTAAGLVGY